MTEGEQTLESLRNAYKESPDDRDAGTKLAQYYSDMGWYNEALSTYKELLHKHRDDYSLVLDYGNLCYNRQVISEALNAFKKLTVLKPDRLEGWNNLGIVQLTNGDQEAAKRSFARVLKLEPDNSGALLNMGNYYDSQGNVEKAIDCFERATQSRLDFYDGWFNLGNAYVKKGLVDKAIRAYERALKYQPEFGSALKNLGYAYELNEDYEQAEECYTKALGYNRADAALYVNLANILTKQSQFDKAKDYYLRAVKLAPKEPAGWLGLRQLSLLKGDITSYVRSTAAIVHRLDEQTVATSLKKLRDLRYFEGVDTLIRVLDQEKRLGDDIDAERLLAYNRTGKEKGIVAALYKRLSSIVKPTDTVRAALAFYEYSQGEADICIEQIRQMENMDVPTHILLWQALIEKGLVEQAEQLIKGYLKDHVDCFNGWFLLAAIEADTNRSDKAKADLIMAMENGFTDFGALDSYPKLKKIYAELQI